MSGSLLIFDINFGCPVNKVVSKNGGSSLLRDCPVLAKVASTVVKGVGDQVPVTGKIRIGWDFDSINAVEVSTILEESGMQAVSIHGRTRSQRYSGEADWNVIDECSKSISIPVIGNGDISSGLDVQEKIENTSVSGIMIGRAAMQNPWVFREAKHYLKTGEQLPPVGLTERWELISKHCREAISWGRYGNEKQTLMAMRSRLMAYSKGLPSGKRLRQRMSQIVSIDEINEIAEEHINFHAQNKKNSETLTVV